MLKSLVLLPCSLSALSFLFTHTLAVSPGDGGPLVPKNAQFHRRQTEQTEDGPSSIQDGGVEPVSMYIEEEATPLVLIATPPAPTVTSMYTVTMPSSTYYTTTTFLITPGAVFTPPPPSTVTSTETVTTTVYITGSSPSATSSSPSSTATATDCATLSQELNGQPYVAPLGHDYNIQCNSFYYTDDDNTISTFFAVESFRDCADLCDQQDGCNLFFWGTEAAGQQSQECFLLSSDIYGMDSNTTIADSGVRVGYVSEAGTTPASD